MLKRYLGEFLRKVRIRNVEDFGVEIGKYYKLTSLVFSTYRVIQSFRYNWYLLTEVQTVDNENILLNCPHFRTEIPKFRHYEIKSAKLTILCPWTSSSVLLSSHPNNPVLGNFSYFPSLRIHHHHGPDSVFYNKATNGQLMFYWIRENFRCPLGQMHCATPPTIRDNIPIFSSKRMRSN